MTPSSIKVSEAIGVTDLRCYLTPRPRLFHFPTYSIVLGLNVFGSGGRLL